MFKYIRFLHLIIGILTVCYSQNPSDKHYQCSRIISQENFNSFSSTLTENQKMLDIHYYKINLDIDVVSEFIKGVVTIKGSVGFSQPDTFELDFSDEMTIDSVIYRAAGLWYTMIVHA